MYCPWTSPHILRGASSSRSMGCERMIGLTVVQMSFISGSEMETSVPGGLPRRERRRLVMDCIGSIGVFVFALLLVFVFVFILILELVFVCRWFDDCCCCCCCCRCSVAI